MRRFRCGCLLAIGAFLIAAPMLAQADEPGSQKQMWRTTSPQTRDLAGAEWIAVGYDYDKDGEFDAVEYVNLDELKEIRAAAQSRFAMRDSMERPWAGQRRMKVVRGEVSELYPAKLAGMNRSHLLAKIETPQGQIVPVDLGPADAIRGEINEGDNVIVFGRQVQIGERSIVFANRVRTEEGQTVAIERPGRAALGQRLQQRFGPEIQQAESGEESEQPGRAALRQRMQQRFGPEFQQAEFGEESEQPEYSLRDVALARRLLRHNGEVISTRWMTCPETGERHLIARVELENGRVVPVNLGPRSEVEQLDVNAGDEITFTGTPDIYKGQRIFHARRVTVNGQTATIDQPRQVTFHATRY